MVLNASNGPSEFLWEGLCGHRPYALVAQALSGGMGDGQVLLGRQMAAVVSIECREESLPFAFDMAQADYGAESPLVMRTLAFLGGRMIAPSWIPKALSGYTGPWRRG